MKKFRSVRLTVLVLLSVFFSSIVSASGSFVATQDGIRYIVKDNAGNVQQIIKPEFDAASGNYVVKDRNSRVVATQYVPAEASMHKFKLVAPVDGSSSVRSSKDFLGNTTPVLRALPGTDPRYVQLRDYIQSNPGLGKVVSMQVEARNYKINKLQQEITTGTRDAAFAKWLVNDLQKPIYLEVGNSGGVHHDPNGFIMAQNAGNGQISYRDNSLVNRLVIPPDSEAFAGGMNDSSAASVMAHELGHMIMDQLYERPNYPATEYYGAHSKNGVTDEGFALSEGWAEALEALSTKGNRNSDPWRIKTHDNIEQNKYIYENMGVVEGPNDGILKSGTAMLSTEGVNASLFYDILDGHRVQAPFSKIVEVFESSKPQTYREFVNDYVNKFPEDRTHIIKQFLENTKFATVDSSAGARYKDIHDAQQAYLNATDPSARAQLQNEYNAKLGEYNQWKDQLYKQAVVDGKIDTAIDGQRQFSDNLAAEYRSIKLSETLARARGALGTGVTQAADSIKQSFSVKNVAVTAGTSIAVNLASQIMSGEKPSLQTAFRSVASLQFVGNVVGSSLGAAAGHVFAPLISTFVPIPVVGTLAGALIPTMTGMFGGSFGGNLGAGMSFKNALKALDPVAITGQAVGSTIGSMLGSMIPIPFVGTMIGGIVGGIVGEKIFSGIAKLFGYNKVAKKPEKPGIMQQPPTSSIHSADVQGSISFSHSAGGSSQDPYGIRIPPTAETIPYNRMQPNLKTLKDSYEAAYKNYVVAVQSGNQTLALQRMRDFQRAKERYQSALSTLNR